MTADHSTPSSPNAPETVLQRVQASFARQGLMRLLGAELATVQAGQVTIRLPTRPELTQQHGYIHAGATGAIADSAGGYAALTLMDPADEVVTVEYKINLLAPARGNCLEATGFVLRPGRTLTVCRLEVHAITGDDRTLIAAGQQTLARTTPPSPDHLQPTTADPLEPQGRS